MLWALTHFFVMSLLFLTLVVLVGGSIDSMMCRRLFGWSEGAIVQELDLAKLQGFPYSVAATVVIYTALVSSVVETGDPRYRVPTDSLIIFMCFLGSDLWRRWARLRREVAGHLRYSA
jgi:hypothetical protein